MATNGTSLVAVGNGQTGIWGSYDGSTWVQRDTEAFLVLGSVGSGLNVGVAWDASNGVWIAGHAHAQILTSTTATQGATAPIVPDWTPWYQTTPNQGLQWLRSRFLGKASQAWNPLQWSGGAFSVSYTHLTLPTIYSV